MKYWSFAEKTGPKTLADVAENVPCIVSSNGVLYIRLRIGTKGHSVNVTGKAEDSVSTAATYVFVSYIPAPPPELAPARLSDCNPGQVVRLQSLGVALFWIDFNGVVWTHTEGQSYRSSYSLRSAALASVTNLTATLNTVGDN